MLHPSAIHRLVRATVGTSLVALLMTACGASTGAAPSSSAVADVSPSAVATAYATPSTRPPTPTPAPEDAVPVIVVPVASPEPALPVAWEKGGPTQERPCTQSPAIDGEGRLWVTNCWASEFWIFSQDGTFIESWGEQGSGDGQFDMLYQGGKDAWGGIAFAPDGSFYTYDIGNLRVQHFAADRTLISSWGGFGSGDGQFAKPTYIAVGPDAVVYVADGARKDIQAFDADGTHLRTFAQGRAGIPWGFPAVAPDGEGNVYVDEGASIMKYASDGAPLVAYDFSAWDQGGLGGFPGRDGNLFFQIWDLDDEAVNWTLEVDPDGTVLHMWPALGAELAFDGDRTVYAAHWQWGFARKYELPSE